VKAKIIYIVSFVAAFLLVTGGIIYFNSIYKNIFQFDFSPVKKVTNKNLPKNSKSIQIADLKNLFQDEFKKEIFDSLKVLISNKNTDTVYANEKNNSVLMDSLKNLEFALAQTNQELRKQKEDKKLSADEVKSKTDSTYNAWVQKTSKLYESMDPGRAAKIIESYSDNVARDIIYSMRKKSAAEILSLFNPETANRITMAK
jgi:flagellar motility protein MotE (MotC chaperone)